MDSLQSNLFPDFTQPEQQHLLQSFHYQKDTASRFASSLSSSACSSSASLFPTYATSSSCVLPSSSPPPLPLSLSRRGSACSTSSTGDDIVTAEPEDFPRARLTREQIVLLERQFSETPKPNTKVRRALAETTGLSIQRVGNWFQNRRAKAKLQKRQEEQHTRQILESAGRRRATEPSSPVSFSPSYYYSTESSKIATTMATPKPRRVKSTTELPKTPATRFQESMDSSPYDSPAAASYASLDRSVALAKAAAAVARANSSVRYQENNFGIPQGFYFGGSDTPYSQGLDGTQSPWPISRFSDYGSSNATPLYTPTPAGQLEDPFEYDCMAQSAGTENSETESESFGGYQYPVEDFSAFAAAIQMNSISSTFSLPSAPPGRFAREKSVGPFDEVNPWDHPSHFVRRDSCPGEFIEAFGSVEIEQEPFRLPMELPQLDSQDSLASRRRRPKPTPLGSASLHSRDSLTGVSFPQSAREPKTGHLMQPATPMRRIKSTGASLNKRSGGISKVSPPSSPIDFKRFAEYPLHAENYMLEGATIRPCTSGSLSASTSMPLGQLFNHQSGAPPTPVSPADSENAQQGASQKNIMEPVAIKFDHSNHHNKAAIESQISPPATPSNSAEEAEGPDDITPRIGFPASPSCGQELSSIPRDFYGNESAIMDLFTYSMASAEAMSSNSGNSDLFMREEAFPFERFLSSEVRACVDMDMF